MDEFRELSLLFLNTITHMEDEVFEGTQSLALRMRLVLTFNYFASLC